MSSWHIEMSLTINCLGLHSVPMFCLSLIVSFCSFAIILVSKNRDLKQWRSPIVLAPLCRPEIVVNKEDKTQVSVLNYHSFHDGLHRCKQLSGTQHKCPDLSLDLSSALSSMVFGLDLIWWTKRWDQFHIDHRASSPIHAFHLRHLHRLHRQSHILFHRAWLLHHAHPQWNVHPLKQTLRALQQFHPPNLVMVAHQFNPHQGDTQWQMKREHMASTWIHSGKRTKITMTIRRSTAWHSPKQYVNLRSVKSWTSKDVIHFNFQWQLCCISKPTTSGWGS